MEETRNSLQLFIRSAKSWVMAVRNQKISLSDNKLTSVINNLENVLACEILQDQVHTYLNNFELFMDAYKGRDYVLAADYMEGGIIEPLSQVVGELIASMPPIPTQDGYHVEYTSSGMATLSKKRGERFFYLHSNNCPLAEAEGLVERWIEIGVSHYIVAGLGLGYHAALLATNPLIKVTIYEEDKNVIELCEKYTDVPGIKELPNLTIVHDPEYKLFVKTAFEAEQSQGMEKVCLYHPSIQTISDDGLREKMENLFMQIDNSSRWANNLSINFRINEARKYPLVDDLIDDFRGKTVYLIAGGPSLDKNISLLKNKKENEIVLTTGTSLRRCLQENISPDYVIITDPKQYVYPQIQNLPEGENLPPLLIMSTTYGLVAEDYPSEKYMIYQDGFHLSEEMAAQRKARTYSSGSSVMTTALDVAIQLEARKIVFLGLDLAFTGGKTHHGEAARNMDGVSRMVPDIYGNLIPTSNNLCLYREWIEKRIRRAKEEGVNVEFIDASEGGARVEGTVIESLSEFMEHKN